MDKTDALFAKNISNSKQRRIQLLASGEHSDCTFDVGSSKDETGRKKFHCHKIILIVASEVFDRMFNSEFAEKENAVVRVDDVSPVTFKIFLQYIYTSDVLDWEWLSVEQFSELLYLSDKYMMDDFASACIEKLATRKSWFVEDVLPMLEASLLYQNLPLMALCYEKIQSSAVELLSHTTFYKLSLDLLERVVLVLAQSPSVRAATLRTALHNYEEYNKPKKLEDQRRLQSILMSVSRYTNRRIK